MLCMEEVSFLVDRMLHIVTVGTSIVRNAYQEALKSNSFLASHVEVLERVNRDPLGVDDAYIARGSSVYGDLVSFVAYDPRRASAELNAFYGFLEAEESWRSHYVILYHTDTYPGMLSSLLIRDHLEETREIMGHRIEVVEVKRINGLGRSFWPGLLNLASTLIEDIDEAKKKGYRIAVNLTGGFKPEAGFTVTAASIAGADIAYYIHEATKDVVRIPLLRLKPAPDTCTLLTALRKQILTGDIRKTAEAYGLLENGKPAHHAIKIAEYFEKYC